MPLVLHIPSTRLMALIADAISNCDAVRKNQYWPGGAIRVCICPHQESEEAFIWMFGPGLSTNVSDKGVSLNCELFRTIPPVWGQTKYEDATDLRKRTAQKLANYLIPPNGYPRKAFKTSVGSGMLAYQRCGKNIPFIEISISVESSADLEIQNQLVEVGLQYAKKLLEGYGFFWYPF